MRTRVAPHSSRSAAPNSLDGERAGESMLRNLLMPKLGLTMSEGLISEWKVSPGQAFSKGDVLFVVETEKTNVEIEAEEAGTIVEIVAAQGDVVPVGEVVAHWQQAAEGDTATGDRLRTGAGGGGKSAAGGTAEPGRPAVEAAVVPPGGSAEGAPACGDSRTVATPLARRLASHHGLDLHLVRGSGPSGRIKASDVMAAAAKPREEATPSDERRPATRSPGVDQGTRMPPGTVQAAMARRLTAVKQSVPHFYLASEAEVSALLTLRETLNGDPGSRRITINHVALAAVGRALLDLPWANRVWSNGEFVAYTSTDVGIAIHTPRGLFAPILRDAGRLGLAGVATEATRLVDRAREGHLGPDDMAGGSMTVSNAGMFNVTYLTPIINPGHSAILGVGSVRQVFRPDDEGRPALRREIGLVLACDHRVFDGVAGLKVLNKIVAYLENPLHLLKIPEHAR